MRCEVPHLHVLGHASLKGCHWESPFAHVSFAANSFPRARNGTSIILPLTLNRIRCARAKYYLSVADSH
jgi:hypothetical protein